jgi:hypothetical protein
VKFEEFKKALANAEPHRPEDLPDISLIKLLANPELYNQQVVRVQGFLELEFEGTALYLHREDWEQMLTRNALWLDVRAEIWERKFELTERYVQVKGVFQSDFRGHMDLFGGAITQIQDIRTTPSREEIAAILEQARKKISERERSQK